MKKCKFDQVSVGEMYIARSVGKNSGKPYSALFLKTANGNRIVSLDNLLLADLADISPSSVRSTLDSDMCIVVAKLV